MIRTFYLQGIPIVARMAKAFEEFFDLYFSTPLNELLGMWFDKFGTSWVGDILSRLLEYIPFLRDNTLAELTLGGGIVLIIAYSVIKSLKDFIA